MKSNFNTNEHTLKIEYGRKAKDGKVEVRTGWIGFGYFELGSGATRDR
jgi:hypothetical protein